MTNIINLLYQFSILWVETWYGTLLYYMLEHTLGSTSYFKVLPFLGLTCLVFPQKLENNSHIAIRNDMCPKWYLGFFTPFKIEYAWWVKIEYFSSPHLSGQLGWKSRKSTYIRLWGVGLWIFLGSPVFEYGPHKDVILRDSKIMSLK